MQEEIRAAGEAGAEVYQLDDSWQQCHGTARSTGIGLAEMTSNNRAMDMDFWKISPERLPDGFEPIVAAAEKAKKETQKNADATLDKTSARRRLNIFFWSVFGVFIAFEFWRSASLSSFASATLLEP